MKKRGRGRLRAVGVFASVAAMVLAGVGPASADVTSGYLLFDPNIGQPFTSDPAIMRCHNPANGGEFGYCLYTSSDMGIASPNANKFQMFNTLGFYSSTGLPGTWIPQGNGGVIFDETQIADTPAGSNHAWAPEGYEPGPDGPWFLYVPDVTDKDQFHTTGFINAAWSFTGPMGPFESLGPVRVRDAAGNFVPGGHMSDPEVFAEPDNGPRSMLYADGDFQTCGGYKIGTLDPTDTIVDDPRKVRIAGFPSDWGRCNAESPFTSSTTDRPYLEGPSLYKFSDSAPGLAGLPGPYTLVFPAKPLNGRTPAECAANKGEPGTDKSIIAWATADDLAPDFQNDGDPSDDPVTFTYRGILMCGSLTEWTNQATVTQITTNTGQTRLAMIYHDGPAPDGSHDFPRRATHADCLYWGNVAGGPGRFALSKRFGDAYDRCAAGFTYNALAPKVNGDVGIGQIVQATNSGTGVVKANSFEVSEWERMSIVPIGGGQVALRWAINNRFLSAATTGGTPGTSPMIADRQMVGAWERFIQQNNGDGTISLKSVQTGKFVQTGSGGQLYANLASIGSGDAGRFVLLHQ